MEKIRILTDSGSDICAPYPENLTVIPLTIHFGDEEYLDGVTIGHRAFYEKLTSGKTLPTTSLVSPGCFADAFAKAQEAGETVVAVVLSSKLSGTYQSAMLAAQDFENVYVVDSMNATLGEQILVKYALQLVEDGLSAADIVVTQPQVFFLDAQIQQEVLAVASPILEPFEVGIRFAEKFQFHLFKFPNTEDEVTRCNFVSERFPDLTNAERNFFPSGSLDVCEVYKNTLSRFWTQIQFRLRVFCNALESLKHQVELPNVGEIRLTAVWTRNLLFPDVVHHFFI